MTKHSPPRYWRSTSRRPCSMAPAWAVKKSCRPSCQVTECRLQVPELVNQKMARKQMTKPRPMPQRKGRADDTASRAASSLDTRADGASRLGAGVGRAATNGYADLRCDAGVSSEGAAEEDMS